MTQFSYREQAPVDSVFGPDAFDAQVGKEIPFKLGTVPNGTATVVGARVAPDGRSVELTLEVPDGVIPR